MGIPSLPPEAAASQGQAAPQDVMPQPPPVKDVPTKRQRENPDDPTLSSESDIGAAINAANEKTRKLGKKWKNLPKEMAPRWELLVDEAAKGLKQKHDIIKVAIGDKPYRGLPLDEAEAQTRYLQMRNDIDLQTQALEENIVKTKDGRLLIKKEYLNKLLEFEEKIRKGGINIP